MYRIMNTARIYISGTKKKKDHNIPQVFGQIILNTLMNTCENTQQHDS